VKWPVKVVIVGDILHRWLYLIYICLANAGAEVKVCGPKALIPKH
jgi:aspartate carbamoyltransferase catalytic subunit